MEIGAYCANYDTLHNTLLWYVTVLLEYIDLMVSIVLGALASYLLYMSKIMLA